MIALSGTSHLMEPLMIKRAQLIQELAAIDNALSELKKVYGSLPAVSAASYTNWKLIDAVCHHLENVGGRATFEDLFAALNLGNAFWHHSSDLDERRKFLKIALNAKGNKERVSCSSDGSVSMNGR
ncbi:MAG: hypothetical protein AB7O65_13955 [Candidatus Korobacteraceae bacterium]